MQPPYNPPAPPASTYRSDAAPSRYLNYEDPFSQHLQQPETLEYHDEHLYYDQSGESVMRAACCLFSGS